MTNNKNDKTGQSLDIIHENLEKIKKIVPQAFNDDGVNFDALKQALGLTADDESHYQFTWHGKNAYQRFAYQTSTDSLKPYKAESKNWDSTQNMVIEADNLQALKLLQKSYAGKIKMIYIDPPYNTGKDFVYQDNFNEPYTDYLIKTGQINDNGNKTSTNTEKSGAKHTNWLNMMYPRLLLAQNLLTEDGVIFISIDDNEQANLKKLCDEVFGESNFVAEFIWETKRAARGVPPVNMIMSNHEYIICYGKGNIRLNGLSRDETDFSNPDNDSRGLWRSESMKATGGQNNIFDIINPETGNVYNANWAFSEQRIKEMQKENLILYPSKVDGTPRQKKFIDSYTNDKKAIVSNLGWFSTENSTKFLMSLFDNKKMFDFPKPIDLINFIINQATEKNDIVLDFFAGSGTTAHAVMQLNAEDGGNRKCISVQLPELTDKKSEAFKAGYKTIAEITKERIRRAGNKIITDNTESKAPKDLSNLDIGFKVYKLAPSNIKKWNASFDTIETDIFTGIDRFVDGATDDDVIAELMLKFGLNMAENVQSHAHHNIPYYTIQGTGGIDLLFVCLSQNVSINITNEIIQLKSQYENIQVVFRDNAFTDCDRSNIEHTLKHHNITGVEFL